MQPAPAVTVTLPLPPAAPRFALVGRMVNVQPESWVTVNVWPATVSVPCRAGPLFAETAYCTGPLPLPVAPVLTVTTAGSLLDADQAHPAPADTSTLSVPPPAGKFRLDGAIENAQPEPCVTVNVWPAMVSVPCRAGPLLAETV